MSRLFATGIWIACLLLFGLAHHFAISARHEPMQRSPAESRREAASEWIPSDAELTQDNRGVGWVFGRMMGAADAPGSPNFSPFGSTPRR